MKIYSKEQIYEADKKTLKKENIESINLMERAGGYAFQWIHKRLDGGPVKIKIFCGIGNNGGDGLVIARNLIEYGYDVTTYVVNYSDKRSADFLKAYESLKNKAKDWPTLIKSEEDFPTIEADDLVIDALFGIGYNRPADKWVQSLFDLINKSRAYILSIDMASGLYMDAIPAEDEIVIHPTMVLTFQTPKLIFFLPQTGKYVQNWEVLDIGLDRDYLMKTKTDVELINKTEARQIYKHREKYTHKGTYGHSVIVGGSYGKMGAVILSSSACLRSGSGLVTAYIPQFGVNIMQTALPEVMVATDKQNGKCFEEIDFDFDADVIGIGIGMGTEMDTVRAFKSFLTKNEKPLVIDADGLNILAKNPKFLELLPKETILTPHPKELQRLIGEWKDDFDKLKKTAQFAKDHNLIVVLKGAHTITIHDFKLYINNTGNPGMATAGAGDVLTGVITGLLSQKYNPLEAAIFGVYLHGRAGDIAVNQTSYEGLTAGDIVQFLGKAYLDLFAQENPEQPKGN